MTMGTNFYYIEKQRPPCECCARPYKENKIHVGKRSGGVRFCFDPYFKSYDLWIRFVNVHPDSFYDEYGRKVSDKELVEEIFEWDGKTWIDEYPDSFYMDGKYMFSTDSNFS